MGIGQPGIYDALTVAQLRAILEKVDPANDDLPVAISFEDRQSCGCCRPIAAMVLEAEEDKIDKHPLGSSEGFVIQGFTPREWE